MRYQTYKSLLDVWGLEYLDRRKPMLFVTEGIFGAVRFLNAGYNAIAILTNNPVHHFDWLSCLPYKVVHILDGDEAGRYCLKPALYRRVSNFIALPDGVQLDQMTETEIVNLTIIGKL